ncbi:MAG: histidine phosphatase family protein [Erysipelotrichales bacterium]|nr:histidine phosphatase family protein [Erysipelotrichales bacterium]
MKVLYLVRHGQTLFNEQHKIQGWCDSPLTKLGIYQATKARDYFKENNITFTHAFSSTAERTSDTLEIITDITYKRIKDLREWNFGTLEGESEALNPPLPYKDFFKQYDGETQDELIERICACVKEIMDGVEENSKVLIVSHGAAIANFTRAHQSNWKVQLNQRIGNCCVLKFEYENDTFSLVEIINHEFSDFEGK